MIRHFTIFIVKILVTLFYGHKVYGKKHVPKGGGIVAGNHASFLDPPLIGISCPGKVHFLARASLFHSPLFAWLIRQLNTHPVTKGKENVSAIKMTCDLLTHDEKIVLFPEGGRTPNGELQPSQGGVGLLVLRTHCRVIPTYVHGTYEIWNRSLKFPKLKGKTAVVFGTPLTFHHLEGKDKKEAQARIGEEVMEAISSLKAWYDAGAKGTPP